MKRSQECFIYKNTSDAKRFFVPFTSGLLSCVFLLSLFPSSTPVSADTTVTKNAKIIVPPVCSIGATGMNTHTTTVEIGTYKTNIGTTTATVTCNDSEGFSIYASGFTGDKVGETNSNKLVGTSISSNSTISTGTTSSGGTSSWSMKLAPDTSSNPQYPITILSTYSDYASVPSDYTKVATRTAATDIGTGAEGSTFTTTYAAYISNTQAADTYTGKVKYILVHPNTNTPLVVQPAVGGKITYYPNANGVVGQMGQQSSSNNRTVTLYAPNFKRTGYGFAGWNTEPDYSGDFYGPNSDYTTASDFSSKGLNLFAVWVRSQGSFQKDAASVCASLTKAPTDGTADLTSVSALTDIRDGDTYAIAKLADNKCWMIENLRLDDSAELTVGNTHSPLLPLTNFDRTVSNHLSPSNNPYQEGWCDSSIGVCIDASLLSANNTALYMNNTSSDYNQSGNVYSYGNYYNWYSATAGNGKNRTKTNNFSTPGDICPSGSYLPIGGDKNNSSNSHFWLLGTAIVGTEPANTPDQTSPYYTGNTEGANASMLIRAFPNNFVYSGYAGDSSIGSRNSFGYYWVSTTSSTGYAYVMSFNYNTVNPGANRSSMTSGRVVRCIINGT